MSDTPTITEQMDRMEINRAVTLIAKASVSGLPITAGYVMGLLDAGIISTEGVRMLLTEAINARANTTTEPPEQQP